MKNFRLLFLINVITIVSLTVATIIIISQITKQQREAALKNGIQTAKSYANEISIFLQKNRTTAESLAIFMNNYSSKNREEISNMLENFLREESAFLGVYVGYEPNSFDGKDQKYKGKDWYDASGRFIPYWNRLGDNKVKLEPLISFEDDWYSLPKKKMAPHIFDPFIYDGALMTSYIWPIIKNDTFLGVTGVDISLETINQIVKGAEIYDTGYAFLVSRNGSFIAHPNNSLVEKSRKFVDYAKENQNPTLLEIAKGIIAKETGYVEVIDPHTNEAAFMFYEPIEIGDWGVVVSIPKKELLVSIDNLIASVILIFVITIAFIAVVVYFLTLRVGRSFQNIVDTVESLTVGNLEQKAKITGQDGIAELGISVNKFIDYLYNFIKKSQTICYELQMSVEKVSREGEQLSIRAQREAESISQFRQNVAITTAMVDETSNTVNKIELQVQGVKNTMADISVTSGKMSKILNIIDDISFETNLLAINAAIESAHVGDIGKGFDVVADEMRLLSKRTEVQSTEVNESVNENINKIDESVKSIEDMTNNIAEIAIASEEQALSMKEIEGSIVEIDDFTKQSVDLVNELKLTSDKINIYTRELLDLIQFFQIKD